MLGTMRRRLWCLAVAVALISIGSSLCPQEAKKDAKKDAPVPALTLDAFAASSGGGPAAGQQTPVDPSQFVGPETCKGCHEQEGASYDKGPHGKKVLPNHEGPQFQGCEACHGPGKDHAESGDPDKIFGPANAPRSESSQRCLACHNFGKEHAGFIESVHAKKDVGCVDCHSVHAARVEPTLLKNAQPALCYKCHQSVKNSSQPFHRDVKEGPTACSSCHDPHLIVVKQ